MNYFDDVYLKRMNKDGRTIQERIKTRKEREFDKLFLPKTKYKAVIKSVNDKKSHILCSIQPSSWKQDKIISNILVSTSEKNLFTGDLLQSYTKVKDEEQTKNWLILFVNDDITHGYKSYQVIQLDSYINYTDEYGNTIESFPVKFVNGTSAFIQDHFTSYGSVSFREPRDHRQFISKDYDFLEKELYFQYEDRGWEIAGKDNLSVKGVSYVSITEFLVKPPEPDTSRDILIGEDKNFLLNHLRS